MMVLWRRWRFLLTKDMEKTEMETVGKVTLACLENVRKEASKQTKTLGVGLSLFLPAQIEFLFKAFPNKGEELSTATARWQCKAVKTNTPFSFYLK